MHFWESIDEMPMSTQRISKISIQNEACLLQQELSLITLKPWRSWYVPQIREVDPNQIAGYVKDLNGLTFLTIRNAGHMVPLDKREEALIFMEKFIRNEYFP